ncbi:MAG: hypothetical protein C0483_08205 [Pirellula sp.]|nr:hypothetical protein [Pirellula sp.]
MIAVPTTRRTRHVAWATYVGLTVLSVLAVYMLWIAEEKPSKQEAAKRWEKGAPIGEAFRPPDLGVSAAEPNAAPSEAAPAMNLAMVSKPVPKFLRFPSTDVATMANGVMAVQAEQTEAEPAFTLPAFPQTPEAESVDPRAESPAVAAPEVVTPPAEPAFVAAAPSATSPQSAAPQPSAIEPAASPATVAAPRSAPLMMPPAAAPPPSYAPAHSFVAEAPPPASPSVAPPSMVMAPPAAIVPEVVPSVPLGEGAPSALPTQIPDPWTDLLPSASLPPPEAATISIDDARYMALRNNKDIAVLGFMPQVASAAIGVEEAVFDPVFGVNTQGGHYFRQTSTLINALGTGIPTLNTTFWNSPAGLNQIYLEKLFVTGGKAQIGVGQTMTSYSPTGDFVTVNPAWQSTLNLILEQPLFRGRGAIATEAPLRIARANQNQSWNSFQALVNQILRDAEAAYWETSEAYREFQLRDLSLAQALRTLDREQERMRIGEGAIPDVAQAQEHVEEVRIERADTEKRYIIAQRELRRIMGVPPDDPRPIVPATMAGDAPLVVDWGAGVQQAMGRPELNAQRAVVEAADVEYRRRINGLQPDLAVRAIYSVSGLDSQYDGSWSSLGSWDYNDWTAGVIYKRPFGRRADQSFAQRAQSVLSMETARLRQLEHEVTYQLAGALDDLQAAERLLVLHRRRRDAAAVQLEARRELYFEGRASLRDQVDAEDRYTDAMIEEAAARVDYQRAITRWNFARGAINDSTLAVAE